MGRKPTGKIKFRIIRNFIPILQRWHSEAYQTSKIFAKPLILWIIKINRLLVDSPGAKEER